MERETKDQYYNGEFPNSFNDFLYLSRPFQEEEIQLAEKDALIKLCCALKRKELEYYTEKNVSNNLLERAYYLISENTSKKLKEELITDIEKHFES